MKKNNEIVIKGARLNNLKNIYQVVNETQLAIILDIIAVIKIEYPIIKYFKIIIFKFIN